MQNVELRGGYRDEDGTFHCQDEAVVRDCDIGAFMRQNDRFRAYPVIRTRNVSDAPTFQVG